MIQLNMLRYKTEARPGLVALYDIRPGNADSQLLQPRSPHGAIVKQIVIFEVWMTGRASGL